MRHLHSQPIPLVELEQLGPGSAFRFFRRDRKLSQIYKVVAEAMTGEIECVPVEPPGSLPAEMFRAPFPRALRVLRVGEA